MISYLGRDWHRRQRDKALVLCFVRARIQIRAKITLVIVSDKHGDISFSTRGVRWTLAPNMHIEAFIYVVEQVVAGNRFLLLLMETIRFQPARPT
ncbi:hypothetical protein D3C87_1683820 [compost metagenome]